MRNRQILIALSDVWTPKNIYITSIYFPGNYSYFRCSSRRYTRCMKITKLTTYRVPPRWMLLKIETDEGVVGWGEPVIEGRARTVETAVQ